MKKICSTLLFTLTLGISIHSQAQSYILNWANRTGDTWNDRALSSAEDASGNIYTTGIFNGIVDFDSGPGIFTLTTSGAYDTFILKTDANGVFQWVKQLESYSNGNTGYKITVDVASNVYVCGSFSGITDFDTGLGTNTIAPNGLASDIFVCKLNSSGNLQWVKTFGGTSNDYAFSASINNSNLYVTGQFAGAAVDFEPGPGTSTISSNGLSDVFIAKYDLNGTFIWAKGFGGANNDAGNSIACNSFGDVYVCGIYSGIVDFDSGLSTTTLSSVSNSQDAFIVKYNSAGNFQWVRGFGSNLFDGTGSIDLNSAGEVITGGAFSGTIDFDTGPGTFTVASNGNYDAFVHKLDASGTFQWVKTFGGATGNDGINALEIDPSGNILSTGVFKGVVNFDPSSNTYTLAAVSNGDIFIHKLDGLGNFIWAGALNSNTATANNVPTSIITNTASNIYVSGYFSQTVDFDPSANSYTLANTVNPGAYDFFVAKYSQCVAPVSPSNTTLPNSLSICDGNAASLSVNSSGTVNWYSSLTSTAVILTGYNYSTPTLSTGTYTYYADANTCTVSLNRTPITVTVNPNPTVTLVSSSNSICAGESTTLTASGANNYTWIFPIGLGSSIVVSPMVTTIFTVTGTNSFSCSNTATITQIVDACVGLKEDSKLNESIYIYPNPATDIFTIHSSNTIKEVTITDMIGKIIIHYNFDNDIIEPTINISNIPSGVYFVTMKSNETNARIKIIKQ